MPVSFFLIRGRREQMSGRTVLRRLVMPCGVLLAATFSSGSLMVASAQQSPTSLPAGPGRDVTVSTCSKCHSLANITSQHKDRDGWSTVITKMVGYGAT